MVRRMGIGYAEEVGQIEEMNEHTELLFLDAPVVYAVCVCVCTRAYLACVPFGVPRRKPVVPLFVRPTTSFILSRLFLDRHRRLHREHRMYRRPGFGSCVSFSFHWSTDRRIRFR